MNVIDLLVRDHETVSLLFRSFEEADREDHDTRRDLVQQIHDELEDHAGVEEQVFYPEVARRAESRDPASREQVDEAREEHRVIRELLTQLAAMRPEDDGYDAKVKVLKDMVQHHVREEEQEILPRARRLIDPPALEEMGSAVEAERTQIRTERMAVASPQAVVPPPDDGPPPDGVASGGPRRSSEPRGLRRAARTPRRPRGRG